MFSKYTIAAVAAVALSSAMANAGVVSFVGGVNSDAASNISAANTYTAKTSFGSSAVTVNSVTFDAINTNVAIMTAPGITATAVADPQVNFAEWKTDAAGYPGGSNIAAGDFSNLLNQLRYTPGFVASQSYVLSDLVAGQTYDLRVYGRAWVPGARNVSLDFTGDGSVTNYSFNEDATNDGWYVSYVFTYDGTSTAGFTAPNNFHAYALSNQTVVPEPASLGLLGVAGLGLLARRRA